MVKILAIDPGYDRLGVAILEKENSDRNPTLISSACLTTKSKDLFEDRLFFIIESIVELIIKHKPDHLVLESLFFSNNKKTALLVAETRGALIYIAKKHNLEFFEYHPNSIKLALTGNGKADKNDIKKMIPLLIKFNNELNRKDDELDAIGIGITHFASFRPGLNNKN